MSIINNLGKRLQEERERQGLTLEDIGEKTHIRTRYLEEIEAGDYSHMPGEVYLKGFIRSYAEALGLDGWGFVEEYNRSKAALEVEAQEEDLAETLVAEKTEKNGPSIFQNPLLHPAQERFRVTKNQQDRRIIAWGLVVLLAVSLYFFLVPGGIDAPDPDLSIVEIPPEPITTEPVTTEVEISPQVEELTPPVEAEVTQPVVEVAAPVVVEIAAREDCWLEIYRDGKLDDVAVLLAGRSQTILGQQKIQVRFGNPAGVDVVHNGQAVTGLGTAVQTRVFTADTNYVIQDLRKAEPPKQPQLQMGNEPIKGPELMLEP